MRPAVLVTRATFSDIADRLREYFDVSDNPADTVWSPTELIERLRGKLGVMSTGSERIDSSLLDACPQLKAVCNVEHGLFEKELRAARNRCPHGGVAAQLVFVELHLAEKLRREGAALVGTRGKVAAIENGKSVLVAAK